MQCIRKPLQQRLAGSKMRYQLINVGHSRFNGIVEVKSHYQLMKEIKKHCASKYIDLEWFEDISNGALFAGLHKIGEVKLLKEESKMAKSKSPKKEAKKPKKSKSKGKKKSDSEDETPSTSTVEQPPTAPTEPPPLPPEPPPAPEVGTDEPPANEPPVDLPDTTPKPDPSEPHNM
jgi:hypothetical protein